jgi:hypothetical protein
MASISQTIPGYTSGISRQPDELMLPGQVRDLINGLPDITDGLVKRSGSRFLASLSGATADGAWFSYYRDRNEGAYIGQVQRNGSVNVWHANTVVINGTTKNAGDAVTVSGTASSYFTHTRTNQLKFLTVADTTFVTNVDKVVEMATGTGTVSAARSPQYQAFVELRQLQHGREYSFTVGSSNDSLVNITAGGAPGATTGDHEGRVTSIHVEKPDGGNAPSGYQEINRNDGDDQGISPDCRHQGTEVFSVRSGSGRNLVFRLTATCQVVVREDKGHSAVTGDDYVGSYNITAELLNGGYGWQEHPDPDANNAASQDAADNKVTVRMRGVDYNVRVKSIQKIYGKVGFGFFRPEPSSFDANVEVSADSILSQVKKGTNVNNGQINLSHVEVIGNGIFLGHSSPFTVETTNPDLWRITSMEVNDPSELPKQCKHDMIVEVQNSADSQEDNYYLQFKGVNGIDGSGYWEEVVGPGVPLRIKASTLPKTIQRQVDSNGNIVFAVATPAWVDRKVGDTITNLNPSFIGNKISQTFFHRNRLGFLSEDNVVLSQAGDVYNFFQNSALVVAANDPIDIQASSTQPTRFIDSIETNTGLIIFSETQQFLLHTDSDTLTPDTGKLSNISTYRYSPNAAPISLGTTIGFLDSAGVNGRFFEMFDVRREGEPQIIDQTKIVQDLLEHDTDIVINSRENNTIFFCKSGTPTIHGYRYYNVGTKRVQSAWFTWELPYNIEYLFVLDDELFIISSDFKFLKIELQKLDGLREATGDNFYGNDGTNVANSQYSIHLDSSKVVTGGTYDGRHTSISTTFVGTSTKLAAVNLANGEVYIEDEAQRSGNTYKFPGDFSGDSLVVGWLFDMKVKLPRIYVKQKVGERTTSDVTAALTIQRAHLRFGSVGQITVRVKRLGKENLETVYESTPMDFYDADEATFVPEKTQTIPIYERNKNCHIELKSYHPGPASFHSMTWEGDYTPMHHKRV